MMIEIKKGNVEDLTHVLDIENKAWGSLDGQSMQAEEDKFISRLNNGLVNIAYVDKMPAGCITFFKPIWLKDIKMINEKIINGNWEEYYVKKQGFPKDWHDATEDGNLTNHDSSIRDVFLVGVGINPAFRGNKLVDKLISYTLNEAKINGSKNVFGYGRLPLLEQSFPNGTPLENDVVNYLQWKKPESDLPFDYGQRFHVRNGAKALQPIPKCMIGDSECCDYGFLAHYKLKDI